jgi:hypothetical protein
MDPTRRRARAGRVVSIAAISLLAVAPGLARAQSAEADQRFKEAEALLEAGKVAEACGAFEESNRLEPSAGTLINLGLCKEKLGKLASALAAFRSALERVKDPKKKAVATERAEVLESRVSRLTISIASEARVEGLAVSLDGRRIDEAEYGTAIPLDGGSHEIEAKAPGRRSWSKSIRIDPEGGEAAVRVPVLAEKTPAGAGEPAQAPGGAGQITVRTGLKIAGFSLVGVAVVSTAYVIGTTVSGPIPDYERLEMRPLDSAGVERLAMSGDCDSALGKELRQGANAGTQANIAFDEACIIGKQRFIIGMVGLASGLIGGALLVFAYVGDSSGASKQAARSRRDRRQLTVTPVISPSGGGASVRFAW